MGQYHLTVNLDRHEFIDPHKLGMGLKQLEQFGFEGDMGFCLGMLLSISTGRGGGDFKHPDEVALDYNSPDMKLDNPNRMDFLDKHFDKRAKLYEAAEVLGRWKGQRIAIVGDYSEDGDLPAEFHAGSIYSACRFWQEIQDVTEPFRTQDEYASQYNEQVAERAAAYPHIVAHTWVDISDLLIRYIHANSDVRIDIDDAGWRSRSIVDNPHYPQPIQLDFRARNALAASIKRSKTLRDQLAPFILEQFGITA